MNQNIKLQGLLAMLGMCLLGAFMCMGSPAIADVAVNVEKVAIEPEDDPENPIIPNSKKILKITLNKAVNAVKSTQGLLSANSPFIVSIDSRIDSLKKVNGNKTTIGLLERQKFLLLKHTEEATGSGKNWSMKIERLGIGEGIKEYGDSGWQNPYKSGFAFLPLTIEWTNKDGTNGTANINVVLDAFAKIVEREDGTIEERVISVDLFPQE